MRLEAEQRDLLARTRIGMLALGAARLPLVNPAAFHFGGEALWITTSRHAAKLRLVRRDRRAAFLVMPEHDGRGVLLQGLLETYDPRSLRSQVRAMLQGPGFALNLGGYVLKNAPFVAGYLIDLARIPPEWWPHNRVLLRMRPDRVRLVPALEPPPATAATVPGAPSDVAVAVAREASAQLCWLSEGRPLLAEVAWATDGRGALFWLPHPAGVTPGAPAALVVERRHSFRATRVRGVCLRGRLEEAGQGRPRLAHRYQGRLPEGGTVLRLRVDRASWWRGFEVRTVRLAEVG